MSGRCRRPKMSILFLVDFFWVNYVDYYSVQINICRLRSHFFVAFILVFLNTESNCTTTLNEEIRRNDKFRVQNTGPQMPLFRPHR